MSIRVIIADDHPLVRDGLRLSIERSAWDIAIVGEAGDGREVLRLAQTTSVNVFILDITMPLLNGLETTRELIRRSRSAKVIILSLHASECMVEAAIEAGAKGYMTKEDASQEVVAAMITVHEGSYYFSSRIASSTQFHREKNQLPEHKGGKESRELTRQERRVLQLIDEGQTNKEIASAFERSVHTIHAHRTKIMAKLNLHRQADLMRYAIKSGLAKL